MTQTPEPLAKGKFALYQTPKGGMHLSLQMDGETEPRHIEIPAMMVKMMMRKGQMFAAVETEDVPDAETVAIRNFDGVVIDAE